MKKFELDKQSYIGLVVVTLILVALAYSELSSSSNPTDFGSDIFGVSILGALLLLVWARMLKFSTITIDENSIIFHNFWLQMKVIPMTSITHLSIKLLNPGGLHVKYTDGGHKRKTTIILVSHKKAAVIDMVTRVVNNAVNATHNKRVDKLINSK